MPEAQSDIPHVLFVYPPGAESRGMMEALSELPATIETADHVFQAISRFTARPADVVVLGLSHIDDRDLERAIPLMREVRPGVYILVAFPPRRRESALLALRLGADGYLPEPCYLQELTDLVARGLVRSGRAPKVSGALGDEELERLAGAIGHAVGNPLQIIEFQLAQEEIEPDEIRVETKRIAAVAEELLAFARRDVALPAPGTRKPQDINRLVKEAVPLKGARRKYIRRELTDDLPLVEGDGEKLVSAFRVFASVAEARGPEGRLVVRTARNGGRGVRIVFLASDVLLSDEEASFLFRPFSGPLQGDVGFRASIAESIILSHGGRINVTSREGEGTAITILLGVGAGPGDGDERLVHV